MATRSRQSQSKHDAKVKQVASTLKKQGYKVQADISGFRQPDTIRGYRPDVVATKGRQKKVVEVETTESVGSVRDQKQQQAFRKAAKQSSNTTFSRVVVKTGKQ